MGMFDYIIAPLSILPLFNEEKELLEKGEFQTKSLDSCLETYTIDENGKLNIEYTGAISFYTYTKDKKWIEFEALFLSGDMIGIVRKIK